MRRLFTTVCICAFACAPTRSTGGAIGVNDDGGSGNVPLSGSGTAVGTVDGHPLVVADAVFVAPTQVNPTSGPWPQIVISDQLGLCQYLQSGVAMPPGSTNIRVAFFSWDGGGLPPAGDYVVPAVNGNGAVATFDVTDGGCNNVTRSNGYLGGVSLTTAEWGASGTVKGTYEISFGDADGGKSIVSGTFSAPSCLPAPDAGTCL